VGVCRLGHDFPSRVRNRDSAESNFNTSLGDEHTLCGAVVSGPWATPGQTTDFYINDRQNYRESSATLDAAANVLCAFLGYADQPSGAFAHCTDVERSPFSGR
jgi:hypothetical protein